MHIHIYIVHTYVYTYLHTYIHTYIVNSYIATDNFEVEISFMDRLVFLPGLRLGS